MKNIGLIGGMSWESTQEYYRMINEETVKRLGGLHSARCILFSFDFAEIEQLQQRNEWDKLARLVVQVAQNLERAGSGLVLICSNTMHKIASIVERSITVPLLHIIDTTADEIRARGLTKVGLLGTLHVMNEDFYRTRLAQLGLEAIIPTGTEDLQMVNDVIFRELCFGVFRPESKGKFLEVIHRLEERGAEGIILGCTEMGLLIKQTDISIPVFDTTRIHATAAVSMALK